MKPSLCFGETSLTVSGWECSEQSPAPTYWSAWASKRGRQAWATRDKGHSVTERTSQCPVFFQWANLPIQPHLEPSSWNAVAESVLLHIMARLCLCDAQVFGFIAAPCPQLGIFFEGIMSSCFKEREKTLCRGTEPALDVLITWLALYILWCKLWGRCVQHWALCPAAGTWHRAAGGTPHFALLVSQHWWPHCPHIKTLP